MMSRDGGFALIVWVLAPLGALSGLTGCDESTMGGEPAPGFERPLSCDAVECGEHGRCQVVADRARCVCDPGFAEDRLVCVTIDDPCFGVDCGPGGVCGVVRGAPICRCDGGFQPDGLRCVPVDGPDCDAIACGGGMVCVEGAAGAHCACPPGTLLLDGRCTPAEDDLEIVDGDPAAPLVGCVEGAPEHAPDGRVLRIGVTAVVDGDPNAGPVMTRGQVEEDLRRTNQ